MMISAKYILLIATDKGNSLNHIITQANHKTFNAKNIKRDSKCGITDRDRMDEEERIRYFNSQAGKDEKEVLPFEETQGKKNKDNVRSDEREMLDKSTEVIAKEESLSNGK